MKSAALASSVIFLFSLLNTYESFRHICKSSRRSSQISNVFSTDFEELSRICKSVAVSTNQTATLVNFIQLGDIWAAETSKNAIGEFKRFREGDKVPGCMADVRITTSFQYPARNLAGLTSVSSSNPTITIDGSADSRVAQGILALLCKVSSCDGICYLEPPKDFNLNFIRPGPGKSALFQSADSITD
jgi:hypothetical protein